MNKKKFLATLSPFSVGIWRAIGFFILAPLIYNVYSYFANTGATDNLQYLETYINDSKRVQIELPLNREQIERKYVTNYRDKHNNLIYYFTVSFYDAKMKKYIAICMFEGIDFFNQEKRPGRVERQIKKDNTPYDRSTKSIPYFDVQDNVTAAEYKLFVAEYLIRVLDKKELERLYGNAVHSER